jgi:hypothetical protein
MTKSLYKGISKKLTPKAKRGQIRITELDDDTFTVDLFVLIPNKNAFILDSKKTASYANVSVIGVEFMIALHGGIYDGIIKDKLAELNKWKREAEYKQEFLEEKENETHDNEN